MRARMVVMALASTVATACSQFGPYDAGLCRRGTLEDSFPPSEDFNNPNGGEFLRSALRASGDFSVSATELAGCHSIFGDVTISEYEGTDLSIFAGLRHIDGSLRITGNPNLTSLKGLDGLEFLGGDIDVSSNAKLTDLSALTVTPMGASIRIIGNAALVELSGLPSGNDDNAMSYEVAYNNALQRIVGPDDMAIAQLYVADNPMLEDIAGFDEATTALDVQIRSNGRLQRITGLGKLTEISRLFELFDNPSLASFEGMRSLATVAEFRADGTDRDDGMTSHSALAGFAGLTALKRVPGPFTVATNRTLRNTQGLEGLTTVGNFRIEGNAALANLDGLSGLTTATDGLTIRDNAALTSVRGLSALQTVGTISIRSNPRLPNCEAVSLVDNVPVAMDRDVGDNFNPGTACGVTIRNESDFSMLMGFRTISGDLVIDAPDVTTLAPLVNVRSVDGAVTIRNTAITNLAGLVSLMSVRDGITIDSNRNLESASLPALIDSPILSFHTNLRLRSIQVDGVTEASASIFMNAALQTISMSRLQRSEQIQIDGNGSLTTLSFPALTSLTELHVETNAMLRSIATAARGTGGMYYVGTNPVLTSVAFGGVTTLSALRLRNNPMLATLTGVQGLTRTGDLEVDRLAIANLAPFAALQIVDQQVQILDTAVTDFDGLANLRSVGGNLVIHSNANLTSLSGATMLTSVGGDATIMSNPMLPGCEAHGLVDRLTLLGGTRMISGNLTDTCP